MFPKKQTKGDTKRVQFQLNTTMWKKKTREDLATTDQLDNEKSEFVGRFNDTEVDLPWGGAAGQGA